MLKRLLSFASESLAKRKEAKNAGDKIDRMMSLLKDEESIISCHAFYHSQIQRISTLPLEESLCWSDARIEREHIQRCFRQIKLSGFNGSVVDYICYVGMAYAIWRSDKTVPAEVAEFWRDNQKDRMEIRAALRLFRKFPGYFYGLLNAKWDEKSSAILDRLWYVEAGYANM